MSTVTKDLYDVAEAPPVGHVPARMHAMAIRRESFGEPRQAFRDEVVDVPEIGPREVLVYVMAAGINYNNVWAALGIPVDVIKVHEASGDTTGFHIGGSDASGIVYAAGDEVTNVKVGDEVVIHCGSWDPEAEDIKAADDPMFAPSFQIWGYETNWGSFAQFTKVWAHQCMPKAKHLTWEAAAAPTLVGATAYRMLTNWKPHNVRPGDVVLVWGGAGGLGTMAIQLVRAFGGVPIAVVSSDAKGEYCKKLGAQGYVNRKDFSHWGRMPDWDNDEQYGEWARGARAFGKAVWDALGERKNPRIIFEHPGQDTIPTSIFLVDNGGMVGDLRGHEWLQRRRRPALSLDATEAPAGLALRQRRPGLRLQPARGGGQDRSLPVARVPVRRRRRMPPAHVRGQESRTATWPSSSARRARA